MAVGLGDLDSSHGFETGFGKLVGDYEPVQPVKRDAVLELVETAIGSDGLPQTRDRQCVTIIFDRDRPTTTFEHLARDHEQGPQVSRHEHYEDVVRNAEKVAGETAVAERVAVLEQQGFRIHFHCWTQTEILELLVKLQRRPGFPPFDVEHFSKNQDEMVVVLSRLLPSYRVSLPADWSRPAPHARVAVHPRGGMPLVVTRADDAHGWPGHG